MWERPSGNATPIRGVGITAFPTTLAYFKHCIQGISVSYEVINILQLSSYCLHFHRTTFSNQSIQTEIQTMLLFTNRANSVHNVATPPHNCWALYGHETIQLSLVGHCNRPHEARQHVWSCLFAGEPASKASKSTLKYATLTRIVYIYIYYIYTYIYI